MRHQILSSGKRWYFILFDGNNQPIATSTKTYGTIRATTAAIKRLIKRF